MDYGFVIPTRPPLATADGVRTMALKGEELGFGIAAVPDHVVPPRTFEDRYPYTDSGESPWGGSGQVLEMMTLLAFIAARSTTLKLLTSVMVIPFRHPVLVAKMLATLDVLSGGRVIVGCGVGWESKEHAALGGPPFRERGSATDEFIGLFRELWTSEAPSFEGTYARFSDMPFLPKPVQTPHPPIWIGGESAHAVRRAARLGDGWYPVGVNPRHPLDTTERLTKAIEDLRRYAEGYARDPAAIDLGFFVTWYSEDDAVLLDDGQRRLLTGSAEQIVGDVIRLREAGMRHLVLNFNAPTIAATVERMERFAGEIMPNVGG